MQQVEGKQADRGGGGGEESDRQPAPAPPHEGSHRHGQNEEAHHTVVAAGVRLEGEEERGQERVPRGAEAEESEDEQQDERQVLRPQRAEMRDLVGAYRREGEGRPRQERRQLRRAQAAGQQVRGESGQHEGEETCEIEDEHGVVGEKESGQDEEGGPEDGLVHPEGVAQGMEHVALREADGVGLHGLPTP